ATTRHGERQRGQRPRARTHHRRPRTASRSSAAHEIPVSDSKPREQNSTDDAPLVAVIMGSKSDWETMRHAHEVLAQFGVAHECRIVSAHRTPAWMSEFA